MRTKFKVPRTRKTARKTKKTYTKPKVRYMIKAPEKKYYDYIPQMLDPELQPLPNTIGQCDGGSVISGTQDGVYFADITPSPTAGTAYTNRIGQVIDLSSLVFRAQFISQADLKVGLAFKLQIFYRKEFKAIVPADGLANIYPIYDLNNATGLYDINTLRDPNSYTTFRQIYNKTYSIPSDTFATQGDRIKDVRINLKCNKRIRYNDETGGNGIPAEGQFIMVIQCNTGNKSSATAYTYNNAVALTAVDTGARFLMSIRANFIDI